jgi:hypothetical protein
VSLSEEESDFKTTHTKDVRQFLLLVVEIQVLRPRACVEEFYVTLRHATSCQTRHDTHSTSRHAASRRPPYATGHVAQRRGSPLTSLYVPLRGVTRRHVAQRHATPFASRQSPQPTPLRSAHRVHFCDLHGSQEKKKQRLFSLSVFSFLSIAY